MMKKSRKKLRLKKVVAVLIIIFLLLVIATLLLFNYFMSPVSSKYEEKNVIIPTGSSYQEIASILKKEDLIKNELVFLYYLKLRRVDNIYAAGYYLSPSMNLKEIVDTILKGGHNVDEITITFNEGINMRKIASEIESNTNNSYDDVMNKLKDEAYLDEVIEKYFFVTDEIKNSDIYYSLEGYLFPDTYRFASKDVSVEEIFNTMLEKMNYVLSEYKEEIEKSKYTPHQLLTLASLAQIEGFTKEDFKNVVSVFYNRLDSSMYLGVDVTTYYGVKKDMVEDLYMSEINAKNPYNTRGENAVLFPVGPIDIPGKSAIDAVIRPIKTDYYYYVSDKNNKLYFTKDENEHEEVIKKLQKEGLWYEW